MAKFPGSFSINVSKIPTAASIVQKVNSTSISGLAKRNTPQNDDGDRYVSELYSKIDGWLGDFNREYDAGTEKANKSASGATSQANAKYSDLKSWFTSLYEDEKAKVTDKANEGYSGVPTLDDLKAQYKSEYDSYFSKYMSQYNLETEEGRTKVMNDIKAEIKRRAGKYYNETTGEFTVPSISTLRTVETRRAIFSATQEKIREYKDIGVLSKDRMDKVLEHSRSKVVNLSGTFPRVDLRVYSNEPSVESGKAHDFTNYVESGKAHGMIESGKAHSPVKTDFSKATFIGIDISDIPTEVNQVSLFDFG